MYVQTRNLSFERTTSTQCPRWTSLSLTDTLNKYSKSARKKNISIFCTFSDNKSDFTHTQSVHKPRIRCSRSQHHWLKLDNMKEATTKKHKFPLPVLRECNGNPLFLEMSDWVVVLCRRAQVIWQRKLSTAKWLNESNLSIAWSPGAHCCVTVRRACTCIERLWWWWKRRRRGRRRGSLHRGLRPGRPGVTRPGSPGAAARTPLSAASGAATSGSCSYSSPRSWARLGRQRTDWRCRKRSRTRCSRGPCTACRPWPARAPRLSAAAAEQSAPGSCPDADASSCTVGSETKSSPALRSISTCWPIVPSLGLTGISVAWSAFQVRRLGLGKRGPWVSFWYVGAASGTRCCQSQSYHGCGCCWRHCCFHCWTSLRTGALLNSTEFPIWCKMSCLQAQKENSCIVVDERSFSSLPRLFLLRWNLVQQRFHLSFISLSAWNNKTFLMVLLLFSQNEFSSLFGDS